VSSARVIPCLLLQGRGLVKTARFRNPRYVGDPINAVRIFNDKGVDELVFLDISATTDGREPNFALLSDIAAEAFMPFAYGGGVRSVEQARRLVRIGVEKIVVNSAAVDRPEFVNELATVLGSQSVVVAIDAHRGFLGRYEVTSHSGTRRRGLDPVDWARRAEALGAGEILLTSIERDGQMSGYDLDLVRRVSSAVSIPLVACGGAGTLTHMSDAVHTGGASAVAAGSMFVYHGKHRAVLITYPSRDEISSIAEGIQ